MATLVDKLCELLTNATGRYANPDPARSIELGAFGRIERGVLRKAGKIDDWFRSVNVAIPEFALEKEPSNIPESSTISSAGVQESTIKIGANLGVEPASARLADAKVGLEITFKKEDQFYFHAPGLRFVGIKNMWKLGDKLVELAKFDEHRKEFWDDDYCVVTGVYEVDSMLRIMSERANAKVAFTAVGAGTIEDLYRVGVELGFVWSNDTSSVLRESYKAAGNPCVPFYEVHKVHRDIFGHTWWKRTTRLDP